MNLTTLSLAVAASLCAGAAHAQTPADATVAQPSSPAPRVVSVSTPTPASAPAVVQTPNAAPAPESAPTGVTQIVYTPQLPSAADLTTAAAAQGYTVERIVQTSTQVIAFYKNANGQATTVAYQSLPPSGTAPASPAPAVVVTDPPRTVVYETGPRAVYYDYPGPYYYPRVWYPPVSLNFGFGYRSFHGGHYHGGHHFRRR